MPTTRGSLLCIAVAVALMPACRSRDVRAPADDAVAAQATEPTGSGSGAGSAETVPPRDGDAVSDETPYVAPDDGSAALGTPSTNAAPAPPVEAARPDNLRRALPSSTVALALVDLRAARSVLAEWLAGSRDGDVSRVDLAAAARVADALGDPTLLTRLQPGLTAGLGLAALEGGGLLLVADASFLRDAPAEGGSPVAIGSGANVAVVRDGVVRIGARDVVARAMDEASLDAASLGSVWTTLPSTAIATLLVPDVTRAPERVRSGLAPIGPAQPSAVGFALSGDGAVALTLRSGDREAASRMLGAAQVFVSQSLGALQQRAAPELAGGVGYLSLVNRAVWSRVRLETERDTTIVHLVAPDCGGALANLPTALAIGGALAAAARNPDRLVLPFAPMSAPTTRCDARPPTLPDLPQGHVRIATQGRRNVIVLFDLAGALRAVLPTAGGLLPARLDDRAVQDAVGDRFLGLRGIHDAEGSGAFAMELGRPNSAMLVLPSGSASLAGPNSQLATMRLTQGGHVGALFGAPGENTLARSRAEPDDARLAAADALPDGIWLAVVADADALLGTATGDDRNAIAASIRQSGAAAFGLGGSGIVLVVPQAAADAAALRDALPGFALTLVQRLARRGGSPEAGAGAARVAEALDGVRIDVVSGRATISWGDDAVWSRRRLVALLAGPALGGALPVSGLDLNDVRQRLMQNVQTNPYIRTPRAPTPPDSED